MQLVCDKYLYGLDDSQLLAFENTKLTADTHKAFIKMARAASCEGIRLAICSGYRSFDSQLAIWNAKATGKRKLLDVNSQPVNLLDYTQDELVQLILLWSALPGCSRHHWGTDIDVYDAAEIERNQLNLISSEYQQRGPCHKLYLWLQQHAHQFGFYFPFQAKLSGVSPEPWHLSYFPESSRYLKKFDTKQLAAILDNSKLELKREILIQLDSLANDYVFYVAPDPQ